MTTCTITGFACNCQPDEGVPCGGLAELRKAYAEWRTKAEQLRGTLSLAEEGLANYAQEVEHLRAYQLQMNDILKDNERLRQEIEVLRLYGNKDCTNMADAELERRRSEPQPCRIDTVSGNAYSTDHGKDESGTDPGAARETREAGPEAV